MAAVRHLATSGLDVFAHNIETVASLQVSSSAALSSVCCLGVSACIVCVAWTYLLVRCVLPDMPACTVYAALTRLLAYLYSA